jgi:hypothetical protein
MLVAAGHDPAELAEACRGSTLCLHIRSIGEAAGLMVEEGDKPPRFRSFKQFPTGNVGGTVGRTGENPDDEAVEAVSA